MAGPNFYKIVQMDVAPDVLKSIAKRLSEMSTEEKRIQNGP